MTKGKPQKKDAAPSDALQRTPWIELGGLLLLALLMFGDVLFWGGSRILGNQQTDMFNQFVGWREFGFRELAHGNIALWNPHIYGGAPYFGGFQAALLYPPNFVYLILPLAQAINWSIALHVFMMGAFMLSWMRFRGLKNEAAFLAGALMMFGGTYFPHIYAGHLANLCAMVWAPLILLSIDGVFKNRAPVWVLTGMFAVAMQIFAGHPQYVFCTALAAGAYALLRLIDAERRIQLLAMLATIYIGGALLASMQLLVGMEANAESIRDTPLPFEFAAMFGFPPENLLTLFAPDFFGGFARQPYWGRYYPWEMSVFFGVTGFVLAVYGALSCERKMRLVVVGMIGLLMLLALGAHTPLFRLLYEFAPMFNKFRGMSKFTFPASLFFVALAAHGFDRIAHNRGVGPRAVTVVALAAGGLLLAGLAARIFPWHAVMQAVRATGESYLDPNFYDNLQLVKQAQSDASNALLLAGASLGALAALFYLLKRRPTVLVYAILALAVAEVFFYARTTRDTFDMAGIVHPEVKQFLAGQQGDYRILNLINPNSALLLDAQDLWGADPMVVRRYAEFITWTQGGNPDKATQYVHFVRLDPLYTMLRCRFAIVPGQGRMQVLDAPVPPMPRTLLISKYRVIKQRDDIFAAMRGPGFDPRKEVILESSPSLIPVASEDTGTARVTESSSDYLIIEADVKQPSILLITDIYTSAWRAVALPGSAQPHYDLQPANYILRAVPLAAGHHRLRVEYAPPAYQMGIWISSVLWPLYAMTVAALFVANRRKKEKA